MHKDNRDRLIVYIGNEYGIFYTSEYSMLLGRQVKEPPPGAARSLDDLMQRLEQQPPGT